MEIKKYIALLWHWSWLIILGSVLAGGITFLINDNTTPIYRSTLRLMIDQAPSTTGGTSYADVLTIEKVSQTYVALITTSPILEETLSQLDLPYNVTQLRARISASAPVDTQLINITVEDTSPERAKLIADTLAQNFIAYNDRTQSQRYADPINTLNSERDAVGDQIEEWQVLMNELNALENRTSEQESRLSRLETQQKELQLNYTNIFNKLQDLRIRAATESNNLIVVEPAQINDRPVRPNTINNTILAVLVGAMAAVGIVFLIDYLDDTLKTPDEVVEDTGLSAIGVIAYIKGDKPADRLITHLTPRAPTSEAYRVLRTNLEFASVDTKLSNILVTSPSPGEGKSTTAANLATVLAQAGHRVVLIDADLRRPSQHKLLEVPNNQGLTMALLDSETPVSYHLQNTRIPGLRVMTSGPLPPNPAELLRSQRMAHVLEELKSEADVVIVDTPPALTVADASILGPRVNGVVLVAKIGSTRREALMQAQETLQKTGTNIFGVVLNRSNPARGGYYYNYYYYRYYTYEYGETRPDPVRGKRNNGRPKWLGGQ
jgi:capsular exopolysaccharide synthesis family protein